MEKYGRAILLWGWRMMKHRYAGSVWKCLLIYDKFGYESYDRYLFKLIVRMSQATDLTMNEKKVLELLQRNRMCVALFLIVLLCCMMNKGVSV